MGRLDIVLPTKLLFAYTLLLPRHGRLATKEATIVEGGWSEWEARSKMGSSLLRITVPGCIQCTLYAPITRP
ncbi:hypothetical protein EV363DRAFT_1329301 [Boletus edulis]|uniref:Uncharacterized protein n=1 Tax=Boletus edulis BED1 TaxID=1328754 RepID=A0AAD4GB99_BOLED|nr:hypothetical protein EV363DRAFT_1329301 [Boletus edulis]KAF8434343.1 hypothetical protein L210DRAFT_3553716 [Boletus edulis BED1]